MTQGTPTTQWPQHIHLVGIGGIGMSAIARVLAMQGYAVSGSDLRETPITQGLRALGVRTFVGHTAEHVNGAELVVVSSAIPEDNVEILAAQRAGIPVLKRQQFLGRLLEGHLGIAVAGTHGKTTTSAMIATILRGAGKRPSFIVGGVISAWGTNAEAGEGPYFVIEADEYDRMFLGLAPQIAVITNIEMDHPDCFADIAALREAFGMFLERVSPTGAIIACIDSPQVRLLLAERPLAARAITYGSEEGADYCVGRPTLGAQGEMHFTVSHQGQHWGEFTLRVAGAHNALNATAAALAAAECGLSPQEAAQHLRQYAGTERRFEVKGERAGVVVIDDYAHHPTEIRATLAAARLRYPGRRLVAVFQPHTYSRLAALFEEFACSFDEADEVIVMDIYAARAKEHGTLSAADLVRAMHHPHVRHLPTHERAVAYLLEALRPGDILLTLSAGDGNRVGERLLEELAERDER